MSRMPQLLTPSYMLPQDFVDSGHLDKEEDITWHEGLAKDVHTMELGILY